MKTIIVFLLFTFTGNATLGQQTQKPSFNIPDNEYLATKMVNELEDESKLLSQDIKQLDRLIGILKDNNSILSSYQHVKVTSDETYNSAVSKLRMKFLERNEITNISDYEVRDIASEINSNYIDTYDPYYNEDGSKQNYSEIDASLTKNIEQVKTNFSKLLEKAEKAKARLNIRIKEVDGNLSELYNHKGQNNELHRISIQLGLPAFCVTILLLFIIPYFLDRKSTPNDSNNSNSNNKQYLLDVATVLLLTLTILILGLAKMMTGEVLGTLLGGISGYVLNRTMK